MTGLRYAASGERHRPAVVFLHGFMGSASDWREAAEALSAERFCVAVDLPGHGGSVGLPPETYTMEGAARGVVAVLDERRLESATFVGYSMGGRLALYLAIHHPERCAGLFLESSSPGLEGDARREARRRVDEERAARLESGDFEVFLREWYGQSIFASLARDGGLLQKTISERLRNDPAELAKSLRGMGTGSQPSLWDELGRLRVPTLAVTGELDEKFTALARRMDSLNPGVRPVVVPDVGHNVHAEAPLAYLERLRCFLDAAYSA